MTDLRVVPLRQGRPALSDGSAHLRLLADAIDAGEYDEVTSAFVLLPREDDYPIAFGYGDVSGKNDPIIQCELAKAWFVDHLVKRG